MRVQLPNLGSIDSKSCLLLHCFENSRRQKIIVCKMMSNGGEPIITVTLESPGESKLSTVNLDKTTGLLLNGGPLTAVNTKPSALNKNFWTELPQMVVVETRFITEQIAQQNQIYSAQTILPITKKRRESIVQKSVSQISTQTTAPPLLIDAGTTAKPDFTDASVETESSNPFRDRAIQTTKITKKSGDIGIQCNIEDDLAFVEISTHNDVLGENKLTEKEEFLIFSREKSIFYLNGRRECMVCGEIEISMDRMQTHLARHWGPSMLCHLCGLKFEHEILMTAHRCKMEKKHAKSKKQHHKSYKQCPIFWCGSVCNSRKAFNEHLRQHHKRLKLRRACVTFTHERTLVLQRPVSTQLNSTHRCNICMRFCKNSITFVKHRKRCIASFVERLKRKSS